MGATMDRRRFLQVAATGAAGFGLAACTGDAVSDGGGETAAGGEQDLGDLPDIKWDMPTSWPLNLDTIYGAAGVFSEEVAALTGGRFKITPNESGKLIPGLEVLQNVESGAYPIGHTAG